MARFGLGLLLLVAAVPAALATTAETTTSQTTPPARSFILQAFGRQPTALQLAEVPFAITFLAGHSSLSQLTVTVPPTFSPLSADPSVVVPATTEVVYVPYSVPGAITLFSSSQKPTVAISSLALRGSRPRELRLSTVLPTHLLANLDHRLFPARGAVKVGNCSLRGSPGVAFSLPQAGASRQHAAYEIRATVGTACVFAHLPQTSGLLAVQGSYRSLAGPPPMLCLWLAVSGGCIQQLTLPRANTWRRFLIYTNGSTSMDFYVYQAAHGAALFRSIQAFTLPQDLQLLIVTAPSCPTDHDLPSRALLSSALRVISRLTRCSRAR